ncbi:MAG TPA: zf-HC2 domain-containing protein [Ktedonobacterales bacterium]|nr:zf-HC2 domain-containing protein [Ktedonobacterales bacterium]
MNNHHLSANRPAPECSAIASLLPLLDDEALTPRDATRVRHHLAGCPACQAQRRAYSQLTIALRRHFGPTAFTPLRTEEIMLELPNTDPSAPTLETTPTTPLTPADPLPTRRPLRRIFSGAASLAAVLLIALLATLLFGNRARPGPALKSSGSKTFSQTSFTGISMVSPDEGWMVGSTSTITYATATQSVTNHTVLASAGEDHSAALLYHYLNGKWTSYTISPAIPGISHLTSISMDSPTDGWAVGTWYDGPAFQVSALRGLLLHYDGTTWRQMASPVNDPLGGVYMLSATNGWALTEGPGDLAPKILHYDGAAWRVQALPAGAISANAVLNFTGIAALPDGEAWVSAVEFQQGGSASGTPPPASEGNGSSASSSTGPGHSAPGQPTPPGSVILHDAGGVWTVQATIPEVLVNSVAMAGPGDGWAVGQNIADYTSQPSPQPSPSATALFLRYTRGKWTRVAVGVPGDGTTTQISLTHISLLSPTDGWAVGTAQTMTTSMVTGSSQNGKSGSQLLVPQGSLVFLRYDGSAWTAVAGPSLPKNVQPSLMDASFTASGDGWAVGSLITFPNNSTGSWSTPPMPQITPLVLHDADGAWSTYNF